MDFDENLVKLQKALCSFSSFILGSDGQRNERQKILAPLFEKVTKTDKSKMVFFLVLNTKLNVTEVLKDDTNVGLLTDICPNLEMGDLIDIIVDLELTSSFSDIIRNCPGDLSIELLDKFFSTLSCAECHIEGMQEILVAVYEKIQKIQTGFHNDYCLMEFLNIFSSVPQFLWHNIQVSERKEDYSLLVMNCLLETCVFCTKICKNNTTVLCNNPVFALDFSLFPSFSDHKENELDKYKDFDSNLHLKLYITEILNLFSPVLRNCQNLDFSSELLNKISENAYLLCEEIERTPVEPENIDYLKTIKRKPKTEFDEIVQSDINTIISRLYRKPAMNWFSALIHFPNAFEKEEANICIMNHLHLATSADLKSIMESVLSESEKLSAIPACLQNLYLGCLRKMILEDQLYYLNNYFERKLNFYWDVSSFDEELTERFNKLSESDGCDPATKSFLIFLCIQSPIKTIMKICQQAVASATQLNFCIEHLKMLKAACVSKSFTSPQGASNLNLINSVLYGLIVDENMTAREKEHLFNLITRLLKEKLLNEEFLEICVVEVIRKELMGGNIQNINFLLEILKLFVKSKTLRSNHVVLMVFMLQVLSHASWDCSTFSLQLANIREVVISIITTLIRSTKITDDVEMAWLRQRILKSSNINQVYFCDLWFSYDCEFVASNHLHIQLFMLLHTKSRVHSIIDFLITKFQFKKLLELRTSFNIALIKLFPILTSKEWTSLFTHVKSIVTSWSELQAVPTDCNFGLEVFGVFTTSMYCLARDMNLSREMTSCFEFCLRNFGKVIQQHFLCSESVKSEVGVEVVTKLLFLLNGIRDSTCRKSCSMVLSPIIFEIANRTEDREPTSNDQLISLKELEIRFKEDFI